MDQSRDEAGRQSLAVFVTDAFISRMSTTIPSHPR
jgi:hypothetical protein